VDGAAVEVEAGAVEEADSADLVGE
jgi:hypothetical protein